MSKIKKLFLIIFAITLVTITANFNVEEQLQQFSHTINNNKPLATYVSFTVGTPSGSMYANRAGTYTILVSNIQGTVNSADFNVSVSNSSSFTITKTAIANGRMTITISKGDNQIAAGAYTVQITAGSATQNANFNVKKNYYDFTIANEQTTDYDGNPSNKPNSWQITVSKSYISEDVTNSAFSIKITKGGIDYTDCFDISKDGDIYTITNNTNSNENRPKSGTYTITITYNKADSERGTLTQTTNIEIGPRQLSLTQTSMESHRYEMVSEKTPFDLYVISKKDDNIKYLEGESETTLSSSDFFKKYGIELLENIFDADGHVIYFNGVITITKLTEDKITYIDSENYEHKDEDLNRFKGTYPGVIEALNENYSPDETGQLRYHCTGERFVGERQLSTENRTIFALQGGLFKYRYTYLPGELSDEDFDKSRVQLVVYDETGKKTYGSNVGFDATWKNISNENAIEVTLDYTNTNEDYVGNYYLQLTFEDSAPLKIDFSLYKGEIDYYVTSQYDEHIGKEDQLTTGKPPANRNYEYYLGLHLIRSGVEEKTRSDKQISVNIFDHLVDYDAQGTLYYYNNVDYVVDIKKKIGDQVTFDVTIGGKKETGKTLSVAEFTKQYADAAVLLDKYAYNADGSIITTTDNFELRIKRFYNDTSKNDMMVEFSEKGKDTTEKLLLNDFKLKYPDMYGYLVTRFNFDGSGNIRTGTISGSYRVLVENGEPVKGKEVTDQFKITVNPNPNETEKAIVVLPLTEVDAGTYYVYVSYDVLESIGYINNKEDAAISKALFPEMWGQNIHMTSISYDVPKYGITIGDPKLSNVGNNEAKMYNNVAGQASFVVNPEFIFDESGFDFKVFKNNQDKTSEFTINSDEILNRSHLVTLTTDNDGVETGTYKLKITYEHNGQKCEAEKEFAVSGKYYELDIRGASYLTFIHNYSEKRTITIDTSFVANGANIVPKIRRIIDGVQDEQLTLNQSQKQFTNESGAVAFTYNYKFEKTTSGDLDPGVYTFELTNLADKATMGTYEITFTYQEGNNDQVNDKLEFQVVEDSFQFALSNERATADDSGMSILEDIQTDYINKDELDKLTFKVMYYDMSQHKYVDVSSEGTAKRMFIVTKGWTDTTEVKQTYTGTLSIKLDTMLVDLDGDYYIEGNYRNQTLDFEMGNLRELFSWQISDVKISGKFTTETGDVTVDRLFSNIKDGKIDVTIDSIHTNNANWTINKECLNVLNSENGSCDPMTGTNYNDNFEATNNTGSAKTLSLALKNDHQSFTPGEYALVIYYSSSDYQVYKLQVYHEYVTIKLGEATITTELDDSQTSEEFYKNKKSILEIPVTIYGTDYQNAMINITDSEGADFNAVFPYDEDTYTNEHKIKITYDPSNASDSLHVGEYILEVSNTTADGEVADSYSFIMHTNYFNFTVDGPRYNPDPIYPNAQNGGQVSFRVKTYDIDHVTSGENGYDELSKKHDFAKNAMIRDEAGNDVTDNFQITAQNIVEGETSQTDFDLVASFEKNAVVPGKYTIYTSYAIDNDVINREEEFVINDYAKDIQIDEITVESPTKDGLVHNNIGGKYLIYYSSEYAINASCLKASITSALDMDLTKAFNITVYSDYIEVVYVPTEPVLQSGDYTLKLNYDEKNGHIPFAKDVTLKLYGSYKELILSNIQKKNDPVYADQANNGYTFDINYETLTDSEKGQLKARIYDSENNLVYSDFEEDNDKEDCFEVKNNLTLDAHNMEVNIIPFKAMVGEYHLTIYLANENGEYNASNTLTFTIDRTYYKVSLDDASTISPKIIYQGKSDMLYDRDGADGNYIFTTTYNDEEDLNVYSIKILKNNNNVVKEIKDLDITKDEEKNVVQFTLEDLEPGEYRVALCINGLPYVWRNIVINKYIPITSASIYINYQEVVESGTYNVGDVLNIRYDYMPKDATNPDLVFSIEDRRVAELSGSTIRFLSEGNTTLKLSSTDITIERTIYTRQLLSSNKYDIRRNETKIIYVNTMNTLSLTKTEFLKNLNGVVSNYQIRDTNNRDITNTTQYIGTGMTFINGNEQFKIAVIGDTNGDGQINLGDVAKLFQYVRKKISVNDEVILLAMYIRRDSTVHTGDVAKLFQFYRHKISSI